MSRSTLDRARGGDGQAFRELTAPHARELHVHCYRMLGSLVDAEDALQETLLAAWRGLDGFAGRSSLRAWLYRIATNTCLNAIRTRRRPPEPVPPFDPPVPSRRSEVTWLQPYPDSWLEQAADPASGPASQYLSRETIELAFVAAVQRLTPHQAASLLLKDVLGFSTAEVAHMLGTTPTAVKGAVQRGRAALDRNRPPAREPVPAGRDVERALARRFAAAYAADDVDGVVALLTDDAWWAMPPAPHQYHGPAAVAAFLRASSGGRGGRDLHLAPTRANRQPAFGCYVADAGGSSLRPTGLLVLTTSDGGITAVTRFLDARLPRLFGLPADPGRPSPVGMPGPGG